MKPGWPLLAATTCWRLTSELSLVSSCNLRYLWDLSRNPQARPREKVQADRANQELGTATTSNPGSVRPLSQQHKGQPRGCPFS